MGVHPERPDLRYQLIYMNDVIVIGRTFQDQLNILRKVFQRLREIHLKLSLKKCQLFRKDVRYLLHILSPSGVTTDPEKLEAVNNWTRPTVKHQLSFLGLYTYYRRFISRFANMSKPLIRMTEEKRTFEWSIETEIAFQSLKEALCTPVLGYPRPGNKFIVDTDASNVGIASVL
jgi:hypothetical protein